MGYDENRFVDAVDPELRCSICLDVLKDPLQVPCGHVYCSSCIYEWEATTSNKCPIDRKELHSKMPVSRNLNNILNRSTIKCAFEDDGCVWIGELLNVEHHESKCVFNMEADVTCEACGSIYARKDQDNHDCVTCLKADINQLRRDLRELEHKLTILSQENENLRLERAFPCLCDLPPASPFPGFRRKRDRSSSDDSDDDNHRIPFVRPH